MVQRSSDLCIKSEIFLFLTWRCPKNKSHAINHKLQSIGRAKAFLVYCSLGSIFSEYFQSDLQEDHTIAFLCFPSGFVGLCCSSWNHLHTNLKFGHLAWLGTIELSHLCVCHTGQASVMGFVSVSQGVPVRPWMLGQVGHV